jgi:hypothetical protein
MDQKKKTQIIITQIIISLFPKKHKLEYQMLVKLTRERERKREGEGDRLRERF